MSYIHDHLRHKEKIICETSVSYITFIKALILFLAIFYMKGVTRLFTTEVALTDQRLLGKYGLFSPTIIDLPHTQIERVHVHYGLLGRLFDVGDLMIVTTTGKKITFKGISYPLLLEYAINDAIEVLTFGKRLVDME